MLQHLSKVALAYVEQVLFLCLIHIHTFKIFFYSHNMYSEINNMKTRLIIQDRPQRGAGFFFFWSLKKYFCGRPCINNTNVHV